MARRELTNADGKTIDAELIRKAGDQLAIRVRGKSYGITISTLSKEDQELVREWTP